MSEALLQEQGGTHLCHSCDGTSSYLMFLGLSRALSKYQSLSARRGDFSHCTKSHRFLRQAEKFSRKLS